MNANRWQRAINLRLRRAGVLLSLLCGLLIATPAPATGDIEYEVKAAYLYKFASYVEWPASVLTADAPGEFTIGVAGSPAMAAQLRTLVEQRRLGGRPVRVRELSAAVDAEQVHLLFVGRAADAELARLSGAVATRPVLIVSESSHALDAGSMINFVLVDRRVRFEVARTAAERAGLRLSARLLSAAYALKQGSP